MWCGVHDLWALSSLCWRLVGADVTVMPSLTRIDWLHYWKDHRSHQVPPSTALAVLTNMSEKRQSTSRSAIQVKNQRTIIGIPEKLDVMCRREKLNELLTYGIMLCLIYVKMLIDLQKMLSQDLKCWCSKSTTVLSEWTIPKTMDVCVLQFYCVRNK